LRLAVLNFSRFLAAIVFNLFLIYNPKHSYPACFIRYMKFLFVLAQLGASICTRIMCTFFAICAALAAAFVHYFNWKFDNLFFFWGWIVLNFFLNFEKKWTLCSYKIVLIKKCSNMRSAFNFWLLSQTKPFIIYWLNYAEACDEFAVPISAT